MNVWTGGLPRHAHSAQTQTGSCGIALLPFSSYILSNMGTHGGGVVYFPAQIGNQCFDIQRTVHRDI